ncbi:MAG: hypothetical protein KDK34_11160, partial [Leptospiraceae bacterium]|nr:hypothetical protein [Leptospiraceae bacterium]
NTAIMLQQFDQIAASTPREYNDEWREKKLSEILGANRFKQSAPNVPADAGMAGDTAEERIELSVDSPGAAGGPHDRQRAVDTEAYLEIENMDLSGKWGDAVQRFGVEFLLRIHFRKYEFNTVRHLVNARRVARERDLVFIRDTIRKLEGRLNADPELRNHVRAMADLQAAVLLKLKMIEMAKRDQQPTEPDF